MSEGLFTFVFLCDCSVGFSHVLFQCFFLFLGYCEDPTGAEEKARLQVSRFLHVFLGVWGLEWRLCRMEEAWDHLK